jgi:hypothetical protein
MARLDKSVLNFTGSIGDLSFYRMSGYDGIVVRMKGGPSSERVKTHPRYQRTRENGVEFGGGSTAGTHIRRMLDKQITGPQHGIHGSLNARLRNLVYYDKASKRGERHVLISQGGQELEGFPLNKETMFDAVVAGTLTCTPSRETFSARLDIPALMPGSNLNLPVKLPMYRIVATLIYVPDFLYAGPKTKYQPAPGHITNGTVMAETPWYPAVEGSPATTLDLQLTMPTPPPDESYSLLVAVAIHQGEVYQGMRVQKVKKAGAAKILKVF